MQRLFFTSVLLAAVLAFAGCGNNPPASTSTGTSGPSSTPSPTPPSTSSPTPTPSPSPQYDVSLFPTPSLGAAVGEITIDPSGNVTTKLTGATASTTFTLQFCPAPGQNYTCMDIGNVTSGGSGNANTAIKFPKSGTWAGDFQLSVNGTAQYETNVPANGI